ncbi:MAG: proline--tRNA ligase [Oscillospiraceae bacterium]|nr:proline--tRNA ligase [Oscillospiraceae bacterium]
MTGSQKRVEQITSRDKDFAQWYTDVVKKAGLIDYSGVKGCVILRPYAYAVWENIQKVLDGMFKQTGHENVYMPLLIPESLLQKEKELIEGFAPEVAWVTHGGAEELSERLCIRPTSETLFCEHYHNTVHSWRDLPKLYNQWCSVVRWEKTTRPFLRHREFLWQEGHTVHATADEAIEETVAILETYAELCEKYLAMPVIKGPKTKNETFPGAAVTYAVECMMHDGRGLQAGTSHYFGDIFAKAFDIEFTDKDNTQKHPFQTSWGVSTRLIGGIIMVHGDDSGLILPPRIAPTQLVIVPISMHKEGVLDAAKDIKTRLLTAGIRASMDMSDQSPGWKFAEYEMKGVALRLEIGPRDLAEKMCVIVRRDTGEKLHVALNGLEKEIARLLDMVHDELLERARKNLAARTFDATGLDEMKAKLEKKIGFARAMWCGNAGCEQEINEKTSMRARCVPFEQEKIADTCVCCGSPAEKMVIFGLQY